MENRQWRYGISKRSNLQLSMFTLSNDNGSNCCAHLYLKDDGYKEI